MSHITKTSCTILAAYLFMLNLHVYGQQDNCQKLRVGVFLYEISEGAVQLLDEKYGTNTEQVRAKLIDDKVFGILQGSCPEIDFISFTQKHEYIDPDYWFVYSMYAGTVKTDIKVPGDSIVYTNPFTGQWWGTEYIDPEYNTEGAFLMLSELVVNSPCLPIVLWQEEKKSPDLDLAITENLMSYYRMINVINAHEAKQPTPAREPKMEISLEKDYLSPLDKETRQMEVYVKVKDCHGRYVYFRSISMSQPVYFQKETARCEVSGQHGPEELSGFYTILIEKDYKATGHYYLRRGIDPGTETITLKTCGISLKATRTEQKTLIIRGLEITVKPIRKEIYQEEQTDIIISFKEVDPDGTKEPISGKELEVKINGLVNGKISPRSGFVTDSRGETRLHYTAGDKDEKITIEASFQPPDYPDKAVGKGSVVVKPPEYDAAITIGKTTRKEILKKIIDDTNDGQCDTHTEDEYDLDETIDASIYIQLKLMQSVDMPIYNQRWEYYTPISVNISGFSINHLEKHLMSGNVSGAGCATGGYETTVKTTHQMGNRKINEPTTSPWIVAFDSKTNKAVKMIPAGYGIEYEMDVIEDMESGKWDKDGETNDSKNDTRHSAHNVFKVGPVEDLKADPTFKSGLAGIWDYLKEEVGDSLLNAMPITPLPSASSEKVPEINPDILVQYGDGIKSFGGRGHKEINNPTEYGYEKTVSDYDWHMTRRKIQK